MACVSARLHRRPKPRSCCSHHYCCHLRCCHYRCHHQEKARYQHREQALSTTLEHQRHPQAVRDSEGLAAMDHRRHHRHQHQARCGLIRRSLAGESTLGMRLQAAKMEKRKRIKQVARGECRPSICTTQKQLHVSSWQEFSTAPPTMATESATHNIDS